jgi:hypothetical protein
MSSPLLNAALRVLSCYRAHLEPSHIDLVILRQAVKGTAEHELDPERLACYLVESELRNPQQHGRKAATPSSPDGHKENLTGE